MRSFLPLTLLLTGLVAGVAQAQNRAPVTPTRRNPTERISPMPGVMLPAGVSQQNAEPVAPPTNVRPSGTLPLPAVPSGKVTAGPIDSVRADQPTNTNRRRSTPAAPRRKRP
ncbi:hypothetical protein HMJ29_06720 [Hymenobacter taeanensis]|uniref:Uncharacterized protein n=1 Tax=Hymenobacter taeanensis TaxID=2735321 RepID=A0A6M6BEJ0_9BACT|nr:MULTISPECIES: hypothetical protein [Hymenobacter]QJX46646.1 hypothetical protein HMJ29_06720 [Hymenobacter taeanensis]UOQ80510.1 hypothetical protein MUN83_17060 [Hymenobacter sp. 5414T-23]